MKTPLLLFALAATCACAESLPNTYVLPTETARRDKDLERAITLRMPLERQPAGATVFCENGRLRVWATRYSDTEVRVRRMDGSKDVIEVPEGGVPYGLVTVWPDSGRATRCGLDPSSPLGSIAYIMWGDILLFMGRVAPDAVLYRFGNAEDMRLHFPLTPDDRRLLRSRGVPMEIADLLY